LDVPGSYSVAKNWKIIGKNAGMGQDATQANGLRIWNIVDGRTPLCSIGQGIRRLKKSWPRISRIHSMQEIKKIHCFALILDRPSLAIAISQMP
jgi:hypothetical protein